MTPGRKTLSLLTLGGTLLLASAATAQYRPVLSIGPGYRLTLQGGQGYTNQIQVAATLGRQAVWQPLTNFWMTNLTADWVDLAAGSGPRFYRVQLFPSYRLSATPTPPMGMNTWLMNNTEANQLLVAHYMNTNGLAAAGWSLVQIDDGWASAARVNDLLVPTAAFPHGIKWLANAVHAEGCKLGIYVCPSGRSPEGMPQTDMAHVVEDATTIANWGIDHVKIDGPADEAWFALFSQTLDAVTATNGLGNRVAVEFHVGPYPEYAQWYGNWMVDYCNTTTVVGDTRCNAWNDAIDALAVNRWLTAPGHYQSLNGLPDENWCNFDTNGSRYIFGMMSLASAAMMINTPVSLPPGWSTSFTALMTNAEMLAIHDDPLFTAGWPVSTNQWWEDLVTIQFDAGSTNYIAGTQYVVSGCADPQANGVYTVSEYDAVNNIVYANGPYYGLVEDDDDVVYAHPITLTTATNGGGLAVLYGQDPPDWPASAGLWTFAGDLASGQVGMSSNSFIGGAYEGQTLTNGPAVWTWKNAVSGPNQIAVADSIGGAATNLFLALQAGLPAWQSARLAGTNAVGIFGPVGSTVQLSPNWGIACTDTTGAGRVWIKPLADGDLAVALWNRAVNDGCSSAALLSIDFTNLPGFGTNVLTVRDVWAGTTFTATNSITSLVNPSGLNLYRIKPPVYAPGN